MSYTDIHTHFLPGLDDGPSSFRGTVAMLRNAHSFGTRVIVATPHMFHPVYRNTSVRDVELRFEETCRRLRRLSAEPAHSFLREMTLLLGAENYVSQDFFDALRARKVLSLHRSRHVLVEFGDFHTLDFIRRAVFEVLAAQLVPIIAHIERYPPFGERPQDVRRVLVGDTLAQVNAASVDGRLGKRMQRFVLRLFREGSAHMVATDSHDADRRRPDLETASRYLSKSLRGAAALKVDADLASRLVLDTTPALSS